MLCHLSFVPHYAVTCRIFARDVQCQRDGRVRPDEIIDEHQMLKLLRSSLYHSRSMGRGPRYASEPGR